jgi:hypothetical protein
MSAFVIIVFVIGVLALIFGLFVFVSNTVDWNRLHPSLRSSLRFLGSLNVFLVYCLMAFPLIFIVGLALPSSGPWVRHLVSIWMGGVALVVGAVWAWKGLIPRKFKDGSALRLMIAHSLLLAASFTAAYVSVIPGIRVELGLGRSGDEVILWAAFIVFPVAFVVWTIGLAFVRSSAA